jgi:peptidoglycan hydrolase CwlO-like protein
MENGHTDIKVQLESLRKDIENVNSINNRLDTAIDKLTDVSTSIKSMLAVHEEKIQRQEQIDEVIFDKFKERATK